MTSRSHAPPRSRPGSLVPWVAAALALCGLLLITLSVPRPLRSLRAWRDLASKACQEEGLPQAFLFAMTDDFGSTRWSLLLRPAGLERPDAQRRRTLRDVWTIVEAEVLPDLLPRPQAFTLGRPVTGTLGEGEWSRYPLIFEGRQVLGGDIHIHLAPDGTPRILRGAWFGEGDLPKGLPRGIHPRRIEASALDWLARQGSPLREQEGDSLWLGRGLWMQRKGTWHAVREIGAIQTEPPADWLLLVDETSGTVLEAKDRLLHGDSEPDSWNGLLSAATGLGAVFDSNPIAVSGRWDLRWGDDVRSWIVLRNLLHLDGTGWLQGDRALVKTGTPPRSHQSDLRFVYADDHAGFEEVMAYYHIDRTVTYLDSLGLLPAGPPFPARVHATAMDNSWYRPSTGWLEFGDGGVPDAQDADIIIHELGHAVHDRLVPGFGEGQTIALSEGFSDYLACSRAGDPCVGEWDATAYSPPCLRNIDDPRFYPDDLTGRNHIDGLIWASALWEMRNRLGQLTDVLAVRSLARTSSWSSFEEAALILALVADEELARDSSRVVRGILEERGLLKRRATLEIARNDRFGVPLTFPFPVGDSLSWGMEIAGDGSVVLRDLPPNDMESQGDVTLLIRPLEPSSEDVDGWRVSYDIGAQFATVELTALSNGRPTGRATLELRPQGEILLGWGGEGQGMGREFHPVLRCVQTPPDTIDLTVDVPMESQGFIHRSRSHSSLAGGSLLLSPRPASDPGPLWGLRWEVRPTLPLPGVPQRASKIFASSPTSNDVKVRIQLTRGFSDLVLEIIDVSGRRRAELDIGDKAPGLYSWRLPSHDLASGLFWVVLRDGGRRLAAERVLILR